MIDERLTEILNREKNRKGQLMIPLKDMETLLENGGKISYKNKEVGNCYCHMIIYEGKEFFEVTGDKIVHRVVDNQLIIKNEYDKKFNLD